VIFSKRHKFVFIKGRKVAGTSVELLLSSICGPDDIITPVSPFDERTRYVQFGITARNHNPENENLLRVQFNLLKNSLKQLLGKHHEKHLRYQIPAGDYYNHMPLAEVEHLNGKIPSDFKILAVERCPYRKILSLANWKLSASGFRSGKLFKNDPDAIKQKIGKLVSNNAMLRCRNIELYKEIGRASCRERV